jgi:predicted small lipoprotein YifL
MNKAVALLLPLAATLALTGCGRGGEEGNNLASLDNQLVGNDADPALTSALADQIAVDPSLANQSNRNAVRTPETPTQAQYPAPVPGQPSPSPVQTASASAGAGAACSLKGPFDYNNSWANRLPAAFPVYAGGRITEAAGYDRAGCRVRVVTFTTPSDWRSVVGWYSQLAARAGYSADQQLRGADHVLAGTNEKDDGVYYLIVTPRGSGSEVALIANNGR